MITMSRLGQQGQLGNQMFQYAMLRAVACRNKYEVAIPMNYRGRKRKDQVELEPFQLRDVRPLQRDDRIKHKYLERGYPMNAAVFEQPDGTNFYGYYQTEKYFKSIEDRIRDEFRFRSDIDLAAREYVQGIRGGKGGLVVSVHVRRDDALHNTAAFHDHTVDYFHRGMAQPEFQGGRVTFLFFSDDIPWCEQHFQGAQYRFCGTPSHWHDMAVMSYCDHHIISGSTFGWWGSWLDRKPEKIVVGPEPFFGAGLKVDCRDLLPEEWRKIPV